MNTLKLVANEPKIEEKTETHLLPVKLTESEIISYSVEIAKGIQTLEELQDEKKEVTKEYNDELKNLQKKLSRISRIIKAGQEDREVKCRWDYLWEMDMKRLVRTDTGEVIRTDTIKDHERQKRFPWPELSESTETNEVKKYRPSNGTEGELFQEAFCNRCTKDKAVRENEDFENGCKILAKTMSLDTDDKDFPTEWTYDKDGNPICTAFENDAST